MKYLKAKFNQGFTVIEVLVVIGIIAVLTVIIFPSINNIRAKNRDAERVADISAIQLALSLYYNQHPTGYPESLTQDDFQSYITADSITPPNTDPAYQYNYVALKTSNSGTKCTFYHLGTKLELPSAQIDTADTFNSQNLTALTAYKYCDDNNTGIAPALTQYNVHP